MLYFLELIFPYIVFFYLVDCLVYVHEQRAIIFTHFGKKYFLKARGLRFTGPSPISHFFFIRKLPVFFSSQGVYFWKKALLDEHALYLAEHMTFLPYEKIDTVQYNGNQLVINKNEKQRFDSPATAGFIEGKIRMLCMNPDNNRRDVPATLTKTESELNKIRGLKQDVLTNTKVLDILSFVLFMGVFGYLPLIIYFGLKPDHRVLILFLLVYVSIVFLSVYYARSAGEQDRTVSILGTLILSPVTAVHASQHVHKKMFYEFDYWAMIAGLLSKGHIKACYRKEIHRVLYSIDASRRDDLRNCLKERLTYLYDLIRVAGLRKSDILKPIQKSDHMAEMYCPLCENQFVEGIEVCPECQIGLRHLDG